MWGGVLLSTKAIENTIPKIVAVELCCPKHRSNQSRQIRLD